MIHRGRHPDGFLHSVALMLAVLAVSLKVLVPPGFMVADRTNDQPFPIVICTGQGATLIAPGESLAQADERAPAPDKAAHDAPCAFAGHGAAAPTSNALGAVAVQFIAHPALAPVSPTAPRPGRGAAAPPLPARGPPSLLI